MLGSQTRFQWLSQKFDGLVEKLNDTDDPEERKETLRRMRVLLDELDVVVSSSVKKDKNDTASSLTQQANPGD